MTRPAGPAIARGVMFAMLAVVKQKKPLGSKECGRLLRDLEVRLRR